MAIPGSQGGWENVIGERFFVQKFQPVAADVRELYVDPVNGNDQYPGTGNATAPYATIPRALKDCATVVRQETVIIHLVGVQDHIIPDGYLFPPTVSPDPIGSLSGQPFGFTWSAPVILRADPTLLLTINDANILSQTADAVSGLLTVLTNLALTPAAFNGLWLKDSRNNFARIKSNTNNSLIVCATVALDGPVLVYRSGGTIAPAVPLGNNPTVILRGGNAPYIFEGITFEQSSAGALSVSGGQSAFFVACEFPSLVIGDVNGIATNPTPGFVDCLACYWNTGEFTGLAGAFSFANSLAKSGEVAFMSRELGISVQQSIFEQMISPLFEDVNQGSAGLLELSNIEVLNSAGDAIATSGAFTQTAVKVTTSGGSDVVVRGSITGQNFRAVTSSDSPVTVTSSDGIIQATPDGGNIIANLPNIKAARGRSFTFYSIDDADSLVITPAGGNTIDGAANRTLPAGGGNLVATVFAPPTGSNWITIGLSAL